MSATPFSPDRRDRSLAMSINLLKIRNRVQRARHRDAEAVERREQVVLREDLGDVEIAAKGGEGARGQADYLQGGIVVSVGGQVLGAGPERARPRRARQTAAAGNAGGPVLKLLIQDVFV